MQPKPGAPVSFGKYLLLERIASGGMAEVFRAVMRGAAGFEKPVAVKRILPLFGDEPEFVTLFQDEARIASTLAHGNIAQVFDFGEVEGAFYLTLELVEGLDLAKLVSRLRTAGQPMPLVTGAFIIAEAARGLGYAHEKRAPDGSLYGIIHRDVSPPNILLSYTGEVKVADFGIAKAAGKSHKTATGVIMGKLRYMSPEQVAAEELDPRSDIFSLGVIFYELLVNGPVFEGEQSVRLAELIHSAEIPPPSKRNPAVPVELDTIVMRCLARPRDQRYPRAGDLARELSRYVSQASPDFSCEDLAALVQKLAPPVTAAKVDAGSLEIVPPRPASAPKPQAVIVEEVAETVQIGRQLEMPTRTIDADPRPLAIEANERPRRRVSASLWIGLALGAIILASGVLVVVRFVLPGKDRPPVPVPVDGGTVRVITPDAARPTGPPTGPFELLPTVGPNDQRPLLGAVDELSFTHAAQPTADYTLYLTALDSKVASLVLDAEGRAEPPGPAPAGIEERLADSDVGRAVDATVIFVRATGALPPLVKSALGTFLETRAPVATEATVERGASVAPYSATALAVWLDPRNRRRLEDLARANDSLRRWCATPLPPERHFAPVLCERDALTAALRAAGSPAWRALERAGKATPEIALGTGSVALADVAYAEASRTELRLVLNLRITGIELPPLAGFALLGGNLSGPVAPEPGAEGQTSLVFRVPKSLFAPVLQVAGSDATSYLEVPAPPWGGVR